jgi:L-arabinokinase
MKKIAYYITAHGYGHGARSCDILHALRHADANVPIIVKTDLPRQFLTGRLPESIEIRPGAFDTGMIQKDAIHHDLEASLEAVVELYANESELIEQEAAFLRDESVGVVVADIPAIPLAAAQKERIPDIACGNFGWDWIYSEYVQYDQRWQCYADKIRTVYQNTHLLLQQPLSEPMSAFPNRIKLALLAKSGTERKERIVELSGADSKKQWLLLSFYALSLDQAALDHFAMLKDVEVFCVEPLKWPGSCVHSLSPHDVSFSDILASMDVVVTKPGFGIISECIANDKPIVYSNRANFAEYEMLVGHIEQYCQNTLILNEELYAGRLERALGKIAKAPPPPKKMPRGGAGHAAKQILKRLK